jgi:replicative DNA helicase
MSKDLKIPVLALAQLSRECEKMKRQPMLSDLRESGSIEQDADVVMFLHDPRAYDESQPEGVIEVVVAKHRGGKRGIVRIGWKAEYTKFHDNLERSIYD